MTCDTVQGEKEAQIQRKLWGKEHSCEWGEETSLEDAVSEWSRHGWVGLWWVEKSREEDGQSRRGGKAEGEGRARLQNGSGVSDTARRCVVNRVC